MPLFLFADIFFPVYTNNPDPPLESLKGWIPPQPLELQKIAMAYRVKERDGENAQFLWLFFDEIIDYAL